MSPTDDLLDDPTPDLLLRAYVSGIFPMADDRDGSIGWYSPDPRGVIPLDADFHVPRNVARLVRQGRFDLRTDTDFEGVMRACAAPRPQEHGTWIDERLVAAYVGLYEQGFAHSVEAWREDQMVGGLYGVSIGGAFFGESMFIRPDLGGSGSSKVCLVHLVAHLRAIGATLLDAQFVNDHLVQFGCHEIRRAVYLRRLEAAVQRPVRWDAMPFPPNLSRGADPAPDPAGDR